MRLFKLALHLKNRVAFIFWGVLIQDWLGDALDLDGDAGHDVGKLLVAFLQYEGVDDDVEDDHQLNQSTDLQRQCGPFPCQSFYLAHDSF